MPSYQIRLPYADTILFRGPCPHTYTTVQCRDAFPCCTSGIWKHALRLSSLLSTCNTTSFHANVIDPETLHSAGAIADKVFLFLIKHMLHPFMNMNHATHTVTCVACKCAHLYIPKSFLKLCKESWRDGPKGRPLEPSASVNLVGCRAVQRPASPQHVKCLFLWRLSFDVFFSCLHVCPCIFVYNRKWRDNIRYGTCETLALYATHFFLENDLFTSVHKFMEKAHGSSLSISVGTSSTISIKLLVVHN